MEPELLERAQKVADLANSRRLNKADFQEVSDVYYLLTGRKVRCKSCEVYTLINAISKAVIQQPKEYNQMAKYQFKPEHRGVKVIRHTEEGVTKVITSENLNKSDNAEFLAGSKQYAHLIEETKTSKEAESPKKKGEENPGANEAKK